MKRIAVAVLCMFVLAAPVAAQPSISGVTGTLTDGASVTIAGSGFGTKSPAAPMIWDDGDQDADPANNGWDTVWSHPNNEFGSQSNVDCDQHYRTYADVVALNDDADGVAMPHTHATRYLTSAHCDNSLAGSTVGVGVVFAGTTVPFDVFTSVYERYDPNWCFNSAACPDAGDDNQKPFTWASGLNTVAPADGNYWYAADTSDGSGWLWQTDRFGNPTAAGTNPWTSWRQVQFVMRMHTSTGSITLTDNGATMWTLSNVDTSMGTGATDCAPFANPCWTWWVGGYYRPYGFATSTRQRQYFTDIYVDRTWARVIVADNATYASSTCREPQPPTAWSGSSITVTMNQGCFADDSTAYVFVFDSTNTPNSAGFPITFGTSGSGGGTPSGGRRRLRIRIGGGLLVAGCLMPVWWLDRRRRRC